jgi:hypothetical protein
MAEKGRQQPDLASLSSARALFWPRMPRRLFVLEVCERQWRAGLQYLNCDVAAHFAHDWQPASSPHKRSDMPDHRK